MRAVLSLLLRDYDLSNNHTYQIGSADFSLRKIFFDHPKKKEKRILYHSNNKGRVASSDFT